MSSPDPKTGAQPLAAAAAGTKPGKSTRLARPIQRQSLPETLAANLRERILIGEFEAGEQLRQEALAEEYAVSRMPVREALRQLEAEGFVVMQTHKGAVVSVLSPEQISELFDLRALLEADLLVRAIGHMTPAALEEAETLLAELEAALAAGDVQVWGSRNWAFHRSLYAPADRGQTLAIVHNLNQQTDRYVRLQLLLTGGFTRANHDHRTLLDLCRRRDAIAARALIIDHIQDAKQQLLTVMAARHDAAPLRQRATG